jgi:hypothetical protein
MRPNFGLSRGGIVAAQFFAGFSAKAIYQRINHECKLRLCQQAKPALLSSVASTHRWMTDRLATTNSPGAHLHLPAGCRAGKPGMSPSHSSCPNGIYRLTRRLLQRSFLCELKIFQSFTRPLRRTYMNFTKSILFAVLYGTGLLAPAMAIADTEPTTFQAEKDRHIAKILARIQIDQKNLSCVQNAQDQTALNACDATGKQDHEALEPKVETPAANKKAPVADKKTQNSSKNKAK